MLNVLYAWLVVFYAETEKESTPKKSVKKRRVKPKGQRKFHKQKQINATHTEEKEHSDDVEAAVIVSGSPNVSVSALLKRNNGKKKEAAAVKRRQGVRNKVYLAFYHDEYTVF